MKKILIRIPNWLGDCVMASPVFFEIKKHWPQASIDLLSQGNAGDLFLEDPSINKILKFQKKHPQEALAQIKKENYDISLLLTNSFSSAKLFWKARIPQRIGFKGQWRSLLLKPGICFPREGNSQHLVLTYKELLRPLGITPSPSAPKLFLSKKEIEDAKQFLENKGVSPSHQLIGINPGAAYGSAKCWLPDRFQKVTELLLKKEKTCVVYFGDPAGASLVKEICHSFPKRVINVAGQTNLRQLMALIAHCSIFLTNDSGPMHMAAALNIPLLALFGSTSDLITGPYQIGKVIHKHVSCSPCYKRTCPIDFRCMKSITVEEVAEELQKMAFL